MFSTPETSVHVRDKNREISPLEIGRLRGKGSGEKVSFKTRMEDRVRHANHRRHDNISSLDPPKSAVIIVVSDHG